MGQCTVDLLGLHREIPSPHAQLLYSLSLSMQNRHPRQISPVLWCWAPALAGLSFSDLVQ